MNKIKSLSYIIRNIETGYSERKMKRLDTPILVSHNAIERDPELILAHGGSYKRLSINYGACWHDEPDNYHELYEERYNISTWPTANMELLVAYFDKDSSLHPYPNNLIVYNADGSIRHIVPPPVLATQPDRRKVLMGDCNGMGTPMDPKHQEQNLIKVVYFSNDNQVKETSLLDPYTGKLVEVLESEVISYDRLIRGG